MFNFTPIAAACLIGLAAATPAFAAETRDYDDAIFAAAQAQGRSILVDVKAWWCPVCASQSRTIKALTAAPEYNTLLILNVNYDKQTQAKRKFEVTRQATLIGFKGARQVGRLDFVTDKAKIGALLASTTN